MRSSPPSVHPGTRLSLAPPPWWWLLPLFVALVAGFDLVVAYPRDEPAAVGPSPRPLSLRSTADLPASEAAAPASSLDPGLAVVLRVEPGRPWSFVDPVDGTATPIETVAELREGLSERAEAAGRPDDFASRLDVVLRVPEATTWSVVSKLLGECARQKCNRWWFAVRGPRDEPCVLAAWRPQEGW